MGCPFCGTWTNNGAHEPWCPCARAEQVAKQLLADLKKRLDERMPPENKEQGNAAHSPGNK